MAPRPFESKIQNLVYNVDVGIGPRVVKVGLYGLFVLIVMLLYTATQFRGLRDAEAMDCAQIARNLAAGRGFTTQCVRPISLWCLIEKSPAHNPRITRHPDIFHAPAWPALLAALFRLSRIPLETERGEGAFPPEQWVIAPIGHLFTLLTGLLVFRLGRRLFDRRVGLLGATVFYLSDIAWSDSLSGTGLSLLTFLTTAAFYAAVAAGANRQEPRSRLSWFLPYGLALAFCITAFLTRYAAAVLVPAVALYVGFSFGRRGWTWALAFVLAFLVGISPWLVRNRVVSGGVLGLAPYAALAAADADPAEFERTLAPTFALGDTLNTLQTKFLTGLAGLYRDQFRSIGEGLFVCLFLTAFFYRFVRPPVHLLRLCLLLGLVLLVLVASLFGPVTARLLHAFWPLIILYGLAFFTILIERLQLRVRLFTLAVTAFFVFLGALPLILTLMPPRAGVPYPPYFPPFIVHVCKMLKPDEMLCTDMPWATAWYGNRDSLLLPATLDDFYEINDYNKRISGLYFTTITRNKPYVRNLLAGPDRSWFPLLEGRMPADFPLSQGFPMNNMDQLFLTDRQRWNE